MQVKRIVAGDMRRALQIVREKLGPDAIILSNKRTPSGVEILCTLDEQVLEQKAMPQAAQAANARQYTKPVDTRRVDTRPANSSVAYSFTPPQTSATEKPVENGQEGIHVAAVNSMQETCSSETLGPRAAVSNVAASESRADTSDKTQGRATKPPQESQATPTALATNAYLQTAQQESVEQLGAIRTELDQMREWLEAQIGSMAWSNLKTRSPVKTALWKRLSRLGLSGVVLHQVLDDMPDDIGKEEAWLQSLSELAGKIPVSQHDLCASGGIHAFVGPAGAGKTTTIGKLAARHVLQYGKESLGLISMDNQRIGGHEQLKMYARLLDVPLKIVSNFGDLQQALMSYRNKSLVLIDTAGLNAKSPELADQLEVLASSANIHCHLVIDSTSQYSSMVASCAAYQDADIRHCVLTKLDETISLGEAISVVIEQQIPIAYVSNGQSVPDHLSWIKPRVLISHGVKLSRLAADDEDSTIINFTKIRRGVDELVH